MDWSLVICAFVIGFNLGGCFDTEISPQTEQIRLSNKVNELEIENKRLKELEKSFSVGGCNDAKKEQIRLSKLVNELWIKNKELEKQLSVCCVVKKDKNDSVKEESMRQQDSPKINVATGDEKSSVKEGF